VPADVVDAAITVLAAWNWAVRPTAVLALESERHPLLISSLARRLAELGRLTDLGTLRYSPQRRPVTAANSAYRVAALSGSWSPPDAEAIRAAGGPVLLVDDLADTGWTLTTAARVVREAGASDVLPFALASTS
jgi:ATP-dependent DNA helicase RecQ